MLKDLCGSSDLLQPFASSIFDDGGYEAPWCCHGDGDVDVVKSLRPVTGPHHIHLRHLLQDTSILQNSSRQQTQGMDYCEQDDHGIWGETASLLTLTVASEWMTSQSNFTQRMEVNPTVNEWSETVLSVMTYSERDGSRFDDEVIDWHLDVL